MCWGWTKWATLSSEVKKGQILIAMEISNILSMSWSSCNKQFRESALVVRRNGRDGGHGILRLKQPYHLHIIKNPYRQQANTIFNICCRCIGFSETSFSFNIDIFCNNTATCTVWLLMIRFNSSMTVFAYPGATFLKEYRLFTYEGEYPLANWTFF